MEEIMDYVVNESLDEAKQIAVDFLKLEGKIADQHPIGKNDYFQELIFSLKKEASKSLLGKMWANDSFEEINKDNVKWALIDYSKKWWKRTLRAREYYSEEHSDYDDFEEDGIPHFKELALEFWTYYLKIKALEKSMEPAKRQVPPDLTLESAFISHDGHKENYLRIMSELVEKGYCYKSTYHASNQLNKKEIVSLIKYIGVNYLRKLSNEEVRMIALNTFNVDVAEDTVKKNHPSKPTGVSRPKQLNF